jgi:hypothetical protein
LPSTSTQRTRGQLAAIRAAAPASPVAKAGAKGFTAFYRAAPGAGIPSRHYSAARKQGICDLLALGTQTVLPPSPHPSGAFYRWLTPDTLLTVRASDLPEAPPDLAQRLESALASWLPRREFQTVHGALKAASAEGSPIASASSHSPFAASSVRSVLRPFRRRTVQ